MRRLVCAVAVLAVGTWGCGASVQSDPGPPIGERFRVEVTTNQTFGPAPLFIDAQVKPIGGRGPYTFAWDLGDGTLSAEPNFSHEYLELGSYIARLIATDANGTSVEETLALVVGDPNIPMVEATGQPLAGLAPLTVDFLGKYGGGNGDVQVRWASGNGVEVTSRTTQFTYALAGTYVATFSATDEDGDTSVSQIVVNVGSDEVPVVSVQATPDAGDPPLEVTFTSQVQGGNDPLTYMWDFGDGYTSTDPNPTHTYMMAGAYSARLTVSDAQGDEGTDAVTIAVAPPAAAKPDLVISSITATSTREKDFYENNETKSRAYYVGNTTNLGNNPGANIHPTSVTYTVDVTNIGADLTEPMVVGLYLDNLNEPVVGVPATQAVPVAALAKNQSKRLYFTVNSIMPGNLKSWAMADAVDAVEEGNDGNNARSTNVTVNTDEDWYKVYHPSTIPYLLELKNLPADYDLEVWNSDGFYGGSYNSGTAAEGGMIYPNKASNWWFRVFSPDGAADGTKPYTVWLSY